MATTSEPLPTSAMSSEAWFRDLFRLERDGDRFRSPDPGAGAADRLYGGFVAGLALAAAASTVDPGKDPHSLHCYFTASGRTGAPLDLSVSRLFEGRSFAARAVTVAQDGSTLLSLLCSFHTPEGGREEHPPIAVPFPLDDGVEWGDDERTQLMDQFEIRLAPGADLALPCWARTRDPVDDDALLRACILTYLSDWMLLGVGLAPGAATDGTYRSMFSIDHTVWFHRSYDPHRWHHYTAEARNSGKSLTLAQGALVDDRGTLIASTAQEALLREA